MQLIKDEVTQDSNPKYQQFSLEQLIVNLAVGESVNIIVTDAQDNILLNKQYDATLENAHINVQFQQKEGVIEEEL